MQARMVTSEEESLFHKVSVLDKNTWPSPLPLIYGENEGRELCNHFKIGFTVIKQGYRDFKDNSSATIPKSFLKLKHAINTIAVSSAECGEGVLKNEYLSDTIVLTADCWPSSYLLGPHKIRKEVGGNKKVC